MQWSHCIWVSDHIIFKLWFFIREFNSFKKNWKKNNHWNKCNFNDWIHRIVFIWQCQWSMHPLIHPYISSHPIISSFPLSITIIPLNFMLNANQTSRYRRNDVWVFVAYIFFCFLKLYLMLCNFSFYFILICIHHQINYLL